MLMRTFACSLILCLFVNLVSAQDATVTSYTKRSYMIPMRDGIKLFTVVLAPTHPEKASPLLMQRTPYGSDIRVADGDTIAAAKLGAYASMAKEGYIFV